MRKFKKGGREALSVNIVQTYDFSGPDRVSVFVVKVAGIIGFTTFSPWHEYNGIFGMIERHDDTRRNLVRDLNMAVGPKTLVRLLTAALEDRKATASVSSGYASFRPTVRFWREGSRLMFEAPCGQLGYMTVREAEKLIEGVETLA